jgi:hypothetical protein
MNKMTDKAEEICRPDLRHRWNARLDDSRADKLRTIDFKKVVWGRRKHVSCLRIT